MEKAILEVELTEEQKAEEKRKADKREEFVGMTLRFKQLQDDVLTEYFSTPAIIRFYYLEHLKPMLKSVSNLKQLGELLLKEKTMMESIGREFTKIERIEYRICKKIYRDVVLKQGKELSAKKDLIFHYDDQEVTIDPFEFYKEELVN